MPTILRQGPYRLFFYSGDGDEPMHVHGERENNVAKFWLDPIRLQTPGGFRQSEITRMAKIIKGRRTEIVEEWNEDFGR